MGLKTTNYYVKSLGLTLPEAYALISDLRIMRDNACATFVVQSTRNAAANCKPLETVTVKFKIKDKSANLFEAAYLQAKKTVVIDRWSPSRMSRVPTEVSGPFTGWDDDIVNSSDEIYPDNIIE